MPETDYRLFMLAGAALFAIGFYSLLAQSHLLRRILALNVMGSGVFLIFIALGADTPGAIPDPVPHAMVLTGIVVSVCATGLALALADRVPAAGDPSESDDAGEAITSPGQRPEGTSIDRNQPRPGE
jgi:multicomponent Na+:H+ antiporter subunit C